VGLFFVSPAEQWLVGREKMRNKKKIKIGNDLVITLSCGSGVRNG